MRKAPGGGVLQKETPEPRGAPARKRRDVGGPSIAFREMETGGSPRDSCCLYVGDMIPLPFAHSASASADFHARPSRQSAGACASHKVPGEENKVVVPFCLSARGEERKEGIGQSGTKSRHCKSSPRAPEARTGPGTRFPSHLVPVGGYTRMEWKMDGHRSAGRLQMGRCGWCISSGQRMAWHPKSAARRRGELAAAAEQDVRAPRTVQRNRLLAAGTGQTE